MQPAGIVVCTCKFSRDINSRGTSEAARLSLAFVRVDFYFNLDYLGRGRCALIFAIKIFHRNSDVDLIVNTWCAVSRDK